MGHFFALKDIDIAEENNIYRMLTKQWPVSNWENHGFCA